MPFKNYIVTLLMFVTIVIIAAALVVSENTPIKKGAIFK